MFITFDEDEFYAINSEKITKVISRCDENKESGKLEFKLIIHFEFFRCTIFFSDEKSADAACKELLKDLNKNTLKSNYKFKNIVEVRDDELECFYEDMDFVKSYLNVLNEDFKALNDNILAELKELK